MERRTQFKSCMADLSRVSPYICLQRFQWPSVQRKMHPIQPQHPSFQVNRSHRSHGQKSQSKIRACAPPRKNRLMIMN